MSAHLPAPEKHSDWPWDGRNSGWGQSSKQWALKPGLCRSLKIPSMSFIRADGFFFLQPRVFTYVYYFNYVFISWIVFKKWSQQSNYVPNNIQNPWVAWETVPWVLVPNWQGTCVSLIQPECLLQQFSLWARLHTDPKYLGLTWPLIYSKSAVNRRHTH